MVTGGLPETPAGRQLGWWLTAIEDPNTLTASDVLSRYTKIWPGSDWLKGDAEGRKSWAANREQFGAFSVGEIESVSDCEASVVLIPAKGRRRKITFIVEEEAPHRIRRERWENLFDYDLNIREATPADGEVLADIEHRSPVVVGETGVVTDRGTDYFAAARLFENVVVFLAEVEGQPAAVAWGAQIPAFFGGREVRLNCLMHLRVAPEYQRKGLWGALDGAVFNHYWETLDFSFGYYLAENVAWSHVSEQVRARPNYVLRDWMPTVYRLLIPVGELGGSAAGRLAGPEDAELVASILNEFHDGEEFYLPCSAESLTARLNREPSYSWNHVRITDNAVLGIWPAGRFIKTVTERAGQQTLTRRGHVLDYGFRAGAEDEFTALLGGAGVELAAEDIDTLSIFTSAGSRGQAVLRPFDVPVEAYRFTTGMSALIPDSAQQSGIYTDHRFF